MSSDSSILPKALLFDEYKKVMGRPLLIDDTIVNYILYYIASGNSENATIRDNKDKPNFPCWQTWNLYKSKQAKLATEGDEKARDFVERYQQAHESLYNHYGETIVTQAYDESRDSPLPNGKGGYTSTNTAVLRDRLITDNIKWTLARLMPDKWGDRVIPENSTKALVPTITINVLSPTPSSTEVGGTIDVTPTITTNKDD